MPNAYNKATQFIIQGDYNNFKLLVNPKSPIYTKINQLFQLSIKYGRIEIIEYLLQFEPKLNSLDEFNLAFITACSNGFIKIAKLLLEKYPKIQIESHNGLAIKTAYNNTNNRTFHWLMLLHHTKLKSCSNETNKLNLIKIRLDLCILIAVKNNPLMCFPHNPDLYNIISYELKSPNYSDKYKYYLINLINDKLLCLFYALNKLLEVNKTYISYIKMIWNIFQPYFTKTFVQKLFLHLCEYNNKTFLKLLIDDISHTSFHYLTEPIDYNTLLDGLTIATKKNNNKIVECLLKSFCWSFSNKAYQLAVEKEYYPFIFSMLDNNVYYQEYCNLLYDTNWSWSEQFKQTIISKILSTNEFRKIIDIFGHLDISMYVKELWVNPSFPALCSFDLECSICRDVHLDTTNLGCYVQLNCCNHIFGKSCVQQSVLYGNKNCPLCRSPIISN